MIDRMYRHRRWFGAALVAAFTGAVMLVWVLRLLTGPAYSGISTVHEVINRNVMIAAPEITSDVQISQTFVASDDDLAAVEVFLDTYGRANTGSVDLTVSEVNGPALRAVQADPATIYNNLYHSFAFDPILDSGGRTYEVTISSPEAAPGNAFTVWLGKCDCYPQGVFSVNGEVREDEVLVMRVDYHHGGVVVWRELINRMSQYKPEIMKGAGMVLLGLVSTAFALASLGAVVASPGRSRGERVRTLWIAVSVAVAVAAVILTGAYEGI